MGIKTSKTILKGQADAERIDKEYNDTLYCWYKCFGNIQLKYTFISDIYTDYIIIRELYLI
jgi:hypothetical protein